MSFLLPSTSSSLCGGHAAPSARGGGLERARTGGATRGINIGGLTTTATNANRSASGSRATKALLYSPRQARSWCRLNLSRASTSKLAAAAVSVASADEAPLSTSSSTGTTTWSASPAFDPTAGLSASQLAALSSAVLEATRDGGSRRKIKVSALAKSTGLDRSVVLHWLRSVEATFPASPSSDDSNSSHALKESALGAYAAAGLAAEERAKAASAARQEERRKKREALDAKKKPGSASENNDDSIEGTWSSTNRRRRLGRLSKAAEATLDRIYSSSRYPSNDVVEGAAELHRGEGLTKRGVLDYLAARRREEESREEGAGGKKRSGGGGGGGGRGGGGGERR